jgi:ABC-type histidine transport system ATPase subunit
MGEPAIEVQALRKSFGTKEAVAGIDLQIAAGGVRIAAQAAERKVPELCQVAIRSKL